MFDDGCCAQSEADLSDDFVPTPRSRDASAVDGRFVAPVSKLTKLPKPAPATGSSSAKKRRSASQKAGDSELSDGDGDFKPKHNPVHGNNRKAAAIEAPNQLKRATEAHDADRGLCATTYARSSLSVPPYLFVAPFSFPTQRDAAQAARDGRSFDVQETSND